MTGLRRFEQITDGGTPRAAELADPATAQAQPRRRLPRRAVHGVLLLDKPLGWTSNDLLQKVKNLLQELRQEGRIENRGTRSRPEWVARDGGEAAP